MGDPMSSFVVKQIVPINVCGIDISITNSSLFMLLTVMVIALLLWIGTANRGIVPTKMQVVTEKLFLFANDIVRTNIGERGTEVLPYMISLFLFIMMGNVIGLFPFAFSFTSQLVVTIGLATAVFIASIVLGIYNHGIAYFRHFCPHGIPVYLIPFFIIIELMSFIFRPLSLGIRLFANMVAGHIMIKVIAGFAVSIAGLAFVSYLALIPVAINVLLNIFKLVVCMLQAYVFAVLSCMYISESLKPQTH
jgi:F-type H+-transporting ATPase subunit a